MLQIKPLLFLTLLGLSSLVKTETQANEYTLEHIDVPSAHSSKITPQTLVHFPYPPYIIKHLLRRNFLFVPMIASNSAILNKDVYGPHNSENVQYKRHPKSVFIVYPENQRPPTQPCNLDITDSYSTTTIPPPTTIADDIKTCGYPSDEHSTTTPLTFTTRPILSTDSTTSFTSPIPTNPALPPSSTEVPSSTTTTVETEPTMTSAFPSTSTSENPMKPTTQTTITTIDDKQTTSTTINTNQVTSTTSQLWTRPTISPPTIQSKDPTGTGKMQCSFNGLFRANNFTCDQYLVCINGLTHLMDCPNGLAFNDDKKTCDWPGNVVGCNPRAFENFECPHNIDEDNTISTFRYRDSCSQFIACYRRKPRLLSCREGFSFDEDSEDCIYLKNVTNCKSIIYSF